MSKLSFKRLGVALVSLAVPFMLAAPVAAAPAPDEVSAVSLECILGLGIDISTCAGAVTEGVYEVVEADLEAEGHVVDLGAELGSEPGDFASDINEIAVNPLPPLPPTVTGAITVPAVPFQ
jgi:hypothetical protein